MVQVHPPAPPFPDDRPESAGRAIERLLDREAPSPGERWIVAFSGGPDSTALAAVARPIAAAHDLELVLVHVDHRLDADSGRRADRARELAVELGLPFQAVALAAEAPAGRRESPEAASRRRRYAALESARRELGATRILTAHHRDDQVETILLQLARGVPVERLHGIPERRGAVLRPFLDVTRASLEEEVARRGLEAIRDPTNLDLSVPRNLLRHGILPGLRDRDPGLEDALLDLGRRAARLRRRLEEEFAARLDAFPAPSGPAHTVPAELVAAGSGPTDLAPASWLTGLPRGLRPAALRWLLERRSEPSLPAPRRAIEAFLGDLETGVPDARVDLGPDGAALALAGGRLVVPAPPRSFPARFSYTFSIPGRVELPELGVAVRIERAEVAPWMRRGDPRRAGLAVEAGEATVRSRRPGDRLRPLGAPGRRKLKALLIDRGVPAEIRDRIPLLELAGRIAWIPGVAIAHEMAIGDDRECWLAELEPIAAPARRADEPPERTRI